MLDASARAIVEDRLTNGGLDKDGKPVPGFADSGLALLFDRNPPAPYVIPDAGAVLLAADTGPKHYAASGGAGQALLSFVVEINAPRGVGDGQARAWAEQAGALFWGKAFPAPAGDTGQLETDTVRAPVWIGNDPAGRPFVIAQAIVNLINRSF